jgi:hypothetical protein
MSFVDHYAGLRMLEQRSTFLPADETIKLSLIAIKHPKLHYRSWEEMEKVITEMCQDFSTSESNHFESLAMIDKVERHVISNNSTDNQTINAFKTLLDLKEKSNVVKAQLEYPSFSACIHCESFLAAILCQLHGNLNSNPDRSLLDLFQANPSSYSSSFTPSP